MAHHPRQRTRRSSSAAGSGHVLVAVDAVECPICRRTPFSKGTLGWDKHVGSLERHPHWHPELTDPAHRQAQFIHEFPEFFANARTASRRVPPNSRVAMAPPTAPGPVASPPASFGAVTLGNPASGPPGASAGQHAAHCPTCGQALATLEAALRVLSAAGVR